MKSPISILLAFLVLFASVGMAKTTHFCMGMEMKSEIGFGEKHVDCGMNMPMDHEENQDDNHQDPKSCCENVTTHLQVDDEVSLKKAEIQFNLNFAVALVQVFVFGLDPVSSETSPLPTYYPPPIEQDLQVLHQTFLI
ncbi:HYC_CC_PP family protein [Algoriphagus taiwanensis]